MSGVRPAMTTILAEVRHEREHIAGEGQVATALADAGDDLGIEETAEHQRARLHQQAAAFGNERSGKGLDTLALRACRAVQGLCVLEGQSVALQALRQLRIQVGNRGMQLRRKAVQSR